MSTTASPTEIVVVYSINKPFLMACGVSIRSLVRSLERSAAAAGFTIRILVYHNDTVTDAEFAQLAACARSSSRTIAIELRRFNYRIPVLQCAAPQWNNIETVATLLLPDVLRGLGRAIFLDADTLIVGDIVELWQTELGGRPCGCVLDHDQRSPNTGVILYDIEEWNRRNLTEQCLHYVEHHRTFHVDQEPFVAIADARFAELDIKWNYHGVDNWMYVNFGHNLDVRDIRVVHFNGPPRPWYRHSPRRYADEWRRCLEETPFRGSPLPTLTLGHFLSYRVSRWETRLGNAIERWKGYLLPYLVLKTLRMRYFYGLYRLSATRGGDGTSAG